jgi:hypothetical protein
MPGIGKSYKRETARMRLQAITQEEEESLRTRGPISEKNPYKNSVVLVGVPWVKERTGNGEKKGRNDGIYPSLCLHYPSLSVTEYQPLVIPTT